MRRCALVLAMCCAASGVAAADQSDAALAQKLANPIAALTTFPAKYNWDHDIGRVEGGHSNYVKLEPVIPIRLDQDWTLIARTVMLVVDQTNVQPGSGTQFGLSDTTEAFFFTPNKAGPAGFLWGIGPAVSLPATDSQIASQRWGLGPTVAVIVQPGQWTIGVLADHIWSVGGSGSSGELNETYLQPFVSYTTKDAVTFTLESETYYYWTDHEWSVPLHAEVTKLLRICGQPISVGPAVRYWVANTETGAHNWGFRFSATLLFPDQDFPYKKK
jgi:hypothetical protein